MKLSDCRSAYQELSGKTSEIARTLALSAIAIIWVFKNDSVGGPTIPAELFTPGLFVVAALALDLFQYVAGTVAWGGYGRVREIQGTGPEEVFLAPRWLNWPANVAFYGKLVCVGIAYHLLLAFLLARSA